MNRLTDKEQDVLVALVECGGQRDIMARQLNIRQATLNVHMTSLFRKSGATNSVQLLCWALREAKRTLRPRRIAAIVRMEGP